MTDPDAVLTVRKFVVPGKPVGYIARARGKWGARTTAFYAYRDKIRSLCLHVRNAPSFPVKAIGPWWEKHPPGLVVSMFFASKVRPDPDHVWSAVADSVFDVDKCVVGSFEYGYDKANPRTEIMVSWVAEPKEPGE